MTRSEASPTISALKKIPRKREYLLRLSDGSQLTVTEEDVSLFSLAEGAEMAADLAARLADRHQRAGSIAAAMRLLKVRPRTEAELARGLRARGFAEAAVRRTIDDLKDSGQIDDRLFARLWAAEKIRRGSSGRRRIVAELRAKQIDQCTAEEETDLAFGGEDEVEIARRLAAARAARLPALPEDAMKRRLYEHLLRRGFDSEVAAEAVRFALRSLGAGGGKEAR
jgi:regulatory protein